MVVNDMTINTSSLYFNPDPRWTSTHTFKKQQRTPSIKLEFINIREGSENYQYSKASRFTRKIFC